MTSPERDASPEGRAAKRLKVDDTQSHSNGAAPVSGSEATNGTQGFTEKAVVVNDNSDALMKDSVPDVKTSDNVQASTTQATGEKTSEPKADARDARDATAPVKAEYLISKAELEQLQQKTATVDDDAAEGRGQVQEEKSRRDDRDNGDKRDKRRKGGQNKERSFGQFDDAIKLCSSRSHSDEFSPRECRFGDRCKLCHDLRKYINEGRREDLTTFGGKCPVYEEYGRCSSGWKCRFVKSHMKEVEHEDGRKELVLLGVSSSSTADGAHAQDNDDRPGVTNIVDNSIKIDLNRRRVDFTDADKYITWLNKEAKLSDEVNHRRKNQSLDHNEDVRAQYTEPPLKPSEKRRLYFGRETPVLAPLTTQGNLPFRRLCVELGAQLTYSEMAISLPLIQGTKADWTLLKAHESEITPPKFAPTGPTIVQDYDNSKDLKFGAQISAAQPWLAVKATDVLNRYVPHLRLVDLNCGCPVDSIYKTGSGSALLESHGKLERMIRGMNAVSGEIPITAKIRTGVKSNRPVATTILGKLAFGSRDSRDRLGAPGCAAVTLHGRSREQRYTKRADWAYVAECAAMIKSYNQEKDKVTDTVLEPDESTLPNAKGGKMFFLGNGDCYSHVEYYDNIEKSGVDSVMIGRGALIKPWLFEEIEKGQYLDKSATERLAYIEKFAKYGLEAWGSDELGIGFTRRFLLEWMSFTHRYVPIGLLERLPASLNDRPPAYRGRNELETLLASNNYKDWIKISEMFLGPCHPGFTFQPKHKSNAYEAEG